MQTLGNVLLGGAQRMSRLKLVMQHDERDCGPACVSMILRYYGREIPLYRLRSQACTDCEGTSGLGIVECAEQQGLSCKGFCAPQDIDFSTLPVPCILHTTFEQREHYVVLAAVQKNKVVIYDPAEGKRTLTIQQLLSMWTGVFFVCCPTRHLSKISKDESQFIRYLSLLKPHRILVLHSILASLFLSLFGIVLSFYFRFLIDEVLYSEVKSMLNLCSVCYLVVIIFQSLLMYCRNQILLHVSSKIDISLICDFFYHLLRLPLSFFTSRKTGEILSRIRDTETIRHTLSSTTVSVVMDSIMIVIGGFFLVKTGALLTLIASIPVFVSAIVVWCSTGRFKRLIRQNAILEADKNACMYETINGIATIKALSTEEHAFRRSEVRAVDALRSNMNFESFSNLNGAIQTFISSLGVLLIYWVGSYCIFNGDITLGQLISFITLSGYFLGPLSRLLTMQPHLQEAFVAAERLSDIMELKEENTDSDFAPSVPIHFSSFIEFKDISFSYGTRNRTVKNISFTIKKGQKIAFVGKSGSGKSTVLKLLMSFYKPDEGSICIDGKNISELKIDDYRKIFGYVPQESLLFSGTIAENICWGMEYVPVEQMIQVAKDAQIYDFIMSLPDNFRTLVGEQGVTLSGGERQRIALARILIRNPDIIILDEATASLDSISENAIMQVVDKLTDKTIIMVAHRLSTVRGSDCIFVMDNGGIVEYGNHKHLMKQKGLYARLEKLQQ